ncbi:hypothetical protein R3Q15_09375 [Gordonia amicalis]|uniref:Uncharacterized protein n=1 Tax=Gordonia amicalis TaxID=89053 RepID=A0AAE4UAJ9_9ACTN|nr:hypothetical protein [Gordonia amicalis]MDV6312092.1 hypothetical protein [Gordonia amicalis]
MNHNLSRIFDRAGAHATRLITDEDGMSTAEYSAVRLYYRVV